MERAEIDTVRTAEVLSCGVCGEKLEKHRGGRLDLDKVRESLVGRRIVDARDARGMPALQIEGGFVIVVSDTARTWVEREAHDQK